MARKGEGPRRPASRLASAPAVRPAGRLGKGKGQRGFRSLLASSQATISPMFYGPPPVWPPNGTPR